VHGTPRKMDQYLLLALIITRGLSANQRLTFGECVSPVSARDSNTASGYVTSVAIGSEFPRGVPEGQWQHSLQRRAVRLSSRVRLGTGGVLSRAGRRMAGE
jgi:hypothetical protein